MTGSQPDNRVSPRRVWQAHWQKARSRWASGRMRIVAVLVAVGLMGAVIGAAIAVVVLVYGPQPAPLPPSPSTGSVTLTVDDAFLTTVLRQALRQVPLGIDPGSVNAHITAGQRILLNAHTTTGLFGLTASLAMRLEPVVRQGHLVVRVFDAHIGGLTVPQGMDATIEGAVDTQLRSLGNSVLVDAPHYHVRGVHTTNGHLTLRLGNG